MKNQPIIIIGAGRSGTNILRDSICSIEGFETWPCDEINYIWRHGNITKSSDRFTALAARPDVQRFIVYEFEKFEKASGAEYVVEKTCANSLKIPFINAIFPGAKFIFLVRDGRDASNSAKQRWMAPLELGYILKKVKYVPLGDLPYYGIRYFINRLKKLFSEEKRLAFWGPLYPGMLNDLRKDTLLEVCGKQWRECVEIANADISSIDKSRVYEMKYEVFVNNPLGEMKKVMNFIGREASEKELMKSVEKVSSLNVGKFKKYMQGEDLSRLDAIVEPTMNSVYKKMN
jgi:hypothetical protein